MASTMLATLMVVAVWMRAVVAGGGEASCNVNNIPTMKNPDVAKMEGKWYITHLSHTPPYLSGAKLISYTFMPMVNQASPTNYTVITKDGNCEVLDTDFLVDPEDPARLTMYMGDNIVATVYLLATDYTSTAATYEDVTVNGVVLTQFNMLKISVKDPTQMPNMEVLSSALETFCGKKATSLDYFDYHPSDTSLTCNLYKPS